MRFPQRRRQENSSGGQALAWGRPCPLPSPPVYETQGSQTSETCQFQLMQKRCTSRNTGTNAVAVVGTRDSKPRPDDFSKPAGLSGADYLYRFCNCNLHQIEKLAYYFICIICSFTGICFSIVVYDVVTIFYQMYESDKTVHKITKIKDLLS